MYHISDNIFLSNLDDALDTRLITKHKIDIVVRLSEDENKSVYPPSIRFFNFVMEDNCLFTKELLEYAEEIRKIIDANSDKNILIHCNEGKSRSVSIVAYYLMARYQWPFDRCLDHIKAIKPDVRPNDAFQKLLRAGLA